MTITTIKNNIKIQKTIIYKPAWKWRGNTFIDEIIKDYKENVGDSIKDDDLINLILEVWKQNPNFRLPISNKFFLYHFADMGQNQIDNIVK